MAVSVSIAQAGTIEGTVYDVRTHRPLADATVGIQGTTFFTKTSRNGTYQLSNLPAGQHELVVTYVGYAAISRVISLTADQTVRQNVDLTENPAQLQEVRVTGVMNREAEAAARRSEQNADNIINVVSAARMDKLPDINVANVLQRLSGITIQQANGGDASYAVIRGIEPRYNNTTINGVKVTSPDEKSRFVPLNIIPSDLLQRIEISKALVPSMEGDAIGGTVNMVMKDAPGAALLRASGSLGYSQFFVNQPYNTFDKSAIQPLSPNQRNNPEYVAQPGDFSRGNLNFTSRQGPPNGTAGLTTCSILATGSTATTATSTCAAPTGKSSSRAALR